jgi:hypothetical protein
VLQRARLPNHPSQGLRSPTTANLFVAESVGGIPHLKLSDQAVWLKLLALTGQEDYSLALRSWRKQQNLNEMIQ